MKKFILLLACSVFMISCSNSLKSNDEKAKDLIKQFIEKSFNDPKSYEAVDFSELDTLKTIVFYIPEYLELREIADNNLNKTQLRLSATNSMTELMNNHDRYMGYTMVHSFRANNVYGAKILSHKKFVFNEKLDSIINMIDVD